MRRGYYGEALSVASNPRWAKAYNDYGKKKKIAIKQILTYAANETIYKEYINK